MSKNKPARKPETAPVSYRFNNHQTARLASFLRVMTGPGAEDRRQLFAELKDRLDRNDYSAPLLIHRLTLHRLKLGFAALWPQLQTFELALAKKCCDQLGIWSWVEPLVQAAEGDVEDQGEPLDHETQELDASASTTGPDTDDADLDPQTLEQAENRDPAA